MEEQKGSGECDGERGSKNKVQGVNMNGSGRKWRAVSFFLSHAVLSILL